MTGLRLAVGRGLIGRVTADRSLAISGIGRLIGRTARTDPMDTTFVPIVTLGVLDVLLARRLPLVEMWVAPWTRNESRD